MSGRDGYESSDRLASSLPVPPPGPAPGAAPSAPVPVGHAIHEISRFVSDQPGTMGLIGRTRDFSQAVVEGPLSDINVLLALPALAPLIEVVRASHDLIDQQRLLTLGPLVGAPDSEIVRERIAIAQTRLGRARHALSLLTDLHALEDTPR